MLRVIELTGTGQGLLEPRPPPPLELISHAMWCEDDDCTECDLYCDNGWFICCDICYVRTGHTDSSEWSLTVDGRVCCRACEATKERPTPITK